MKRQTGRTRLYISSWYTGAGSNKSVFTRRPERPFSKLREVYGEELERVIHGNHAYNKAFKTLSPAQKQKIKQGARKEIKRENIKKIFFLLAATIITVCLGIVVTYFINLKLNQ